jgi:acyl dehydratase
VRTRLTVAELPDHVGDALGPSDWIGIDFETVQSFADATGDDQWIHVDIERATIGPFGAPIAQGFLLLTVIAKLFPGILEVTDRAMSVNYGTDRVHFMAPVRVGSEVRLTGTLSGVHVRSDGSSLLSVSTTLELRGADEPAAVASLLFVVRPR